VISEKVLALSISTALNKLKRKDGKQVRAFLDAHCLNDGENWQDGYV
jgi:hypothetical protein